MYVKVTLVLLYGFLELVAQGQDSPVRIGMEFNTVAWPCLSAPLRALLQRTQPQASSKLHKEAVTCSPISKHASDNLPLKFSNGMKIYGLLPGEESEEIVFQPRTWKPWLYFFRRPFSANTLLLLTTNYMVVIDEELQVKQGWILSYIPRNMITGIQSQACGLWNELSVQLKRGDQSVNYKLMLKNEFAEAWQTLWIQHGGKWRALQELAAGVVCATEKSGVNKPVARVIQGSTMMGTDLDEADSFALLDDDYERGCNTIDTAHVYGGGDSERIIGRWLEKRGLREKIVLITKGAAQSEDRLRITPFDIAADLHDSLARLKTDYIDLYLLHRDDTNVPVETS
jgi:hypothetical protein